MPRSCYQIDEILELSNKRCIDNPRLSSQHLGHYGHLCAESAATPCLQVHKFAIARELLTHPNWIYELKYERAQIWRLQLHPAKTPLAADVDFEVLARRYLVGATDRGTSLPIPASIETALRYMDTSTEPTTALSAGSAFPSWKCR